jgi:hypothetical protein
MLACADFATTLPNCGTPLGHEQSCVADVVLTVAARAHWDFRYPPRFHRTPALAGNWPQTVNPRDRCDIVEITATRLRNSMRRGLALATELLERITPLLRVRAIMPESHLFLENHAPIALTSAISDVTNPTNVEARRPLSSAPYHPVTMILKPHK